ncbi:MAG: family 10 glycosylhydrolase [Prevotellaceae bacterium]|jgi:uncharacterized lipoprotein YddW (UPF0748 family)|nr:family 10 glycosylhydrolase [Prevotellaceae bacterium]
MINKIKYLALFAVIILPFAACSEDDKQEAIYESPIVIAEESVMPKPELRGVWMATTFEIDWPLGKHTEAEQKQLYIDYLDKFVETNINAIFFQIRPNGDAFYDSPYESWSKWLTGTAGQDPGYDVLQFLVEEAHARNIQFHAWLNPYRITTRTKGTAFPDLDPKIDSAWIKDYDEIRIYNPALPEVRQRLADIVKDIITKYDVDGIHMDDYFYPDIGDTKKLNDSAEFELYGSGFSKIEDFRIDNINKTVQKLHETIVETKPGVIFSISTTSSIGYNKTTMFADVDKWYNEKWVDVLIPQVYSAIGDGLSSRTSFHSLVNEWNQHYKQNAVLLIGHYISRVGDGTGSQFTSAQEIANQFTIVRRQPGTKGSVLYSAKCFFDNNGHGKLGVIDVLKDLFKNPVILPFMGRKTMADPTPPTNVVLNGTTLAWNVAPELTSVVYVIPEGEKKAQIAVITASNTYQISVKGKYFVTTVNKDNVESEISNEVAYN